MAQVLAEFQAEICDNCLTVSASAGTETVDGWTGPDGMNRYPWPEYAIGWGAELLTVLSIDPCDGCGHTAGGHRHRVTVMQFRLP